MFFLQLLNAIMVGVPVIVKQGFASASSLDLLGKLS